MNSREDAKARRVAVLFARGDSNYRAFEDADVWDKDRDARKWPGGLPVVAHPPCRAYGRLRKFARPERGERALAVKAVRHVRKWGGVVEHPAGSRLWRKAGLPLPGHGKDKYGGWTLAVLQKWWGHRAEKATWLYVCGVEPKNLPAMPITLGEASHVVQSRKRFDHRPHISKAEREHTPPQFCRWLLDLALCAFASSREIKTGADIAEILGV